MVSPSIPLNLYDFEPLAADVLPIMVYGYYVSGANDEITVAENESAFQRIRLRPRMMRGVRNRDTSVTVLGKKLAAPIMIAPMAFMKMADPGGEVAVAKAVESTGLGMILSTMSNYKLEDVAQATDSPNWFQLYVYRDRAVTKALVERAEAAGYEALVLTVDVPVLGKREADILNQFHLPKHLVAANLVDSINSVGESEGQSGLAAHVHALQDDNLTWDDLTWLQSITSLPILVKGVLRGDDAQLALEHGATGIIVSNHGGRQLDTAPAAIDVLPEIADAVGDQVDILVDGGIRRGTDIIKALALGAKAVLVGRPILWALAYDGERGVRLALDLLMEEFSQAMALCGCRSTDEITEDLIL